MNYNDIIEMIKEFRAKLDKLGYWGSSNFAHILLDDYNMADVDIKHCLDRAYSWEEEKVKDLMKIYLKSYEWTPNIIEAIENVIEERKMTEKFLNELLEIPEDIRF